jgi:1-phosphofructokinase
MIYTVTLNPAVDYVVGLDALVSGAVNRCIREDVQFGGKGINVSRVLHQLGIKTIALGFVAGFTGQALEQGLQAMGIPTRFVAASEGMTRINVKINAGLETEINGIGPQINSDEMEQLMAQLCCAEPGDTVVFSGSLPKCLAAETYGRLIDCLKSGVGAVVDTTGDALRNALSRKPYLVKPNLQELQDFFGISMDTKENVLYAAGQMQEMGARNVLVSMAAQGAVLLDETGQAYWSAAPQGEVINSVGAGDSMVAGFLAAVTEGENAEFALRMGIAAGSATAFQSGLAEKEKIMELLMEM